MKKAPMSNAERRDSYIARHRAMGLCIKCPAVATHIYYCRKCWEKQKARQRKSRLARVPALALLGVCIDCGAKKDPEMDTEKLRCVNCATRHRLRPERRKLR
jgi:DNA-directed RNA polymerase subunit RPC12/RpoP